MQASVAVHVRAEAISNYFQQKNWREPKALRSLFEDDAAIKQVGYFTTEDLACLILDATGAYPDSAKAVQRSVVSLNDETIVTCDIIAAGAKASWTMTGSSSALHQTAVPFSNGTSDQVLLHVISRTGIPKIEPLSTLDLAGVRIGDFALLFYVDVRAGRSAVFFDAPGGDNLKILIAGLAPGGWEVWRNGWLDEPRVLVPREANALYYQGKPGGYFLKRTS